MKTCLITLRITYDPNKEGSPDCWDFDDMLDMPPEHPIEIVNYEEED